MTTPNEKREAMNGANDIDMTVPEDNHHAATSDNDVDMTPPNEKKLDEMLTDFEKRTATGTDNPGQNLRKLLDNSPYLKEQFVDSIGHGYLERFDMSPAKVNGGSYNADRKSIALPLNHLVAASTDKKAAAKMVFMMGHEIQHSFNSTVADDAKKTFIEDVKKKADEPGPHDYTAIINTQIQNDRHDEASANIGGFNALVLQVQKENPKATLEDFYEAHPTRMRDFISYESSTQDVTYALKPGLKINDKMLMDASEDNVEAMGKYFFDKTNLRMGGQNNQDYRNYYGNLALNKINAAEKLAQSKHKADPNYIEPKVEINLRKIGLDKTQLHTPLQYTDTTKRKSPATHFEESQPPAKRAKGPFGDPALNEALHAMRSGNDAGITQATQQVKNSPEGQRLTQTAHHLLAEQQRQEPPTQAQPQAPTRPLSR